MLNESSKSIDRLIQTIVQVMTGMDHFYVWDMKCCELLGTQLIWFKHGSSNNSYSGCILLMLNTSYYNQQPNRNLEWNQAFKKCPLPPPKIMPTKGIKKMFEYRIYFIMSCFNFICVFQFHVYQTISLMSNVESKILVFFI